MGRPKGTKNKKKVPTEEGEEKKSGTKWSKRKALILAKDSVAQTQNIS